MKRNILCVSTSNYYPFPTRKQNIMNRLGDCRIVYAEPPVTLIAPIKDPQAKLRIGLHRSGGKPSEEYPHVKIYASPPVIPFHGKSRLINKLNQRKLARYYAELCRENFGEEEFFLWCYSPASADLVSPLARELGIPEEELWGRTVYDCVDRHSAYPGLIEPAVVDAEEEELAGRCNTVFATARGLADRLGRFNENVHLIPNGAAYEIFSEVQDYPKGTGESGRPTFGFVGMFQECIDYEAFRHVAEAFPEVDIVLIGRPLPGVDMGWTEGYPNIEVRKPVRQKDLPGHMKDFDACLNFFADGKLAEDVSPLKFYEYLATGKPIVSTPVPAQVRDFADCVYIGEDYEGIVSMCREALDEDPLSEKRRKRIEKALLSSWDARVSEMRKILGWE